MNPLLSVYKTNKSLHPSQTTSPAEWIAVIKNELHKGLIETVRAARGTRDYTRLKGELPGITWAGSFLQGRRASQEWTPSGLVFADLDLPSGDTERRDAEKWRLCRHPSVLSCYVSPGGAGLHVVAAVDPKPASAADYRAAWNAVTHALALDSRDNDPAVKNHNRLAYVSYDPDAYYSDSPTPLKWERGADGASAGGAVVSEARQPETISEAFAAVAQHYGLEWDGDTGVGLRMACVYHGGSNPASLRVWEGERTALNKKGQPVTSPKLHAKCFSDPVGKCKSNTILRFLEKESGVRWPSAVSPWGMQAKAEDAVENVLAVHRLELRERLPAGHVDVRAIPDLGRGPLPPSPVLAATGVTRGGDGWGPVAGTHFERRLRNEVCRWFKVTDDKSDYRDDFVLVAAKNRLDPLREFLGSLPPWDGEERIGALFTKALGAEDTELNRAAARSLLTGAIRRIRDPGCHHVLMPVLVGDQGIGKSRFCRELLPEQHQLTWFAEAVSLDETAQKIHEGIGSAIIVEFSEMAGMKSERAVEKFKAFIVAQQDRYRLPYGRFPTENPRRWVSIGTSNDETAIPSDDSGSRRYLAVACCAVGPAHWDYVPANRDQLWAEALAVVQAWEERGSRKDEAPNELPKELKEAQEKHNAAFMDSNDDARKLAHVLQPYAQEYVGLQAAVALPDLWQRAHELRDALPGFAPEGTYIVKDMTKAQEKSFGFALRARGWDKQRTSRKDETGEQIRRVLWYYKGPVGTAAGGGAVDTLEVRPLDARDVVALKQRLNTTSPLVLAEVKDAVDETLQDRRREPESIGLPLKEDPAFMHGELDALGRDAYALSSKADTIKVLEYLLARIRNEDGL